MIETICALSVMYLINKARKKSVLSVVNIPPAEKSDWCDNSNAEKEWERLTAIMRSNRERRDRGEIIPNEYDLYERYHKKKVEGRLKKNVVKTEQDIQWENDLNAHLSELRLKEHRKLLETSKFGTKYY